MKKMKILTVLLIVALMSACQADYTLEIDENLNFRESITLTEENNFFLMNNTTPEEYTTTQSEILSNVEKYSDFQYKFEYLTDETILNSTRELTYEDFSNNALLIGTLFENFYTEIDDDLLTIKTQDYNGHAYFGPKLFESDINYSDISITIKSPLKLISTNADLIDEKNGLYTWKYDNSGYELSYTEGIVGKDNVTENDTIYKNIEIVFDTKIDIWTKIKLFILNIWYVPIIIVVIIGGYTFIKTKKVINNKI